MKLFGRRMLMAVVSAFICVLAQRAHCQSAGQPTANTARGGAIVQKGNARNLEKFGVRRAYPGAPPAIPHPLPPAANMDMNICASCHGQGGFVPAYQAFAPVTPHPERRNCKQCHVPQADVADFRNGNKFNAVIGPKLRRAALPGGPPPIPHPTVNRESCLSCHAGPAAVVEIRTGHPERVHCQQCHVAQFTSSAWARKAERTIEGVGNP